MKFYCVVYLVDGIHYRYRCTAKNKSEAKRFCIRDMFANKNDIVDVYEEY